MALPSNTLGILFAEVLTANSDETSLSEWLSRQRVAQALSMITEVVHKHNGIVSKSFGDSVLTTFPNADATLKAACAMHETVLRPNLDGQDGEQTTRSTRMAVQLRVSVNFGKMVVAAGNIAGDAIDLAAMLVQETKPGQILATEALFKSLSNDNLRNLARESNPIEISGFSGPVTIYDVDWLSGATSVPAKTAPPQAIAPPRLQTVDPRPDTVNKAPQSLALRYQDVTVEVGPSNPVVTLGRSSGNNLVIKSPHVSRKHAVVEYSAGKPELVNLSPNGSCLKPEGKDVLSCTSRLPLSGNGVIGLGPDLERSGGHVVHYSFPA